MKRGFNHIDLATKDMAATRAFYEGILGFPVVRSDIVEFEGRASAQHVYFDCGEGQMIAFASSANMPADLDTGINRGLGLPPGVYHFASEAGSLENLQALKASLEAHGVAVGGVEDHEGWRRSIYFTDPNQERHVSYLRPR
jgi:catechol 2,3-dioxygenase-like lactoylglutathione lyase family enzyme